MDKITILCSGASLGTYVPAVVASHQLQAQGLATDVVVLENMLFADKRNNVNNIKVAFHRNFRFALASQKLAKDIMPSVAPHRLRALLATWKMQQRKRFMLFTGFWTPIVQQYLQETNDPAIAVDLCHTDASVSTSWKFYAAIHPAFRHIWLYSLAEKRVNWCFPVSAHDPLPYDQRSSHFLIHGGGWGVGTYQHKIPELEAWGIPLDVIAYEAEDLTHKTNGNRYFMTDPEWQPWDRNAQDQHCFPPFGEVHAGGEIIFQNSKPYPEVYDLIRYTPAIISKPGGATLIDSLSAATPLILLDPYGDYEEANARLWEELGFGIPYQTWVDTGCSRTMLEECHINLRNARESLPNYISCINNHTENNRAQLIF